jgi:hypothetical protein
LRRQERVIFDLQCQQVLVPCMWKCTLTREMNPSNKVLQSRIRFT